MTTGTTGTPAARAARNAPGLNGSGEPPWVVVPSGKFRTDAPEHSARARVRTSRAPESALPRSTNCTPLAAAIGPTTGQLETSLLATGKQAADAMMTKGSSQLTWLATR